MIDTSAAMALVMREPGAERVADLLGGARISTVNLAEFGGVLLRRGFLPTSIETLSEAYALRAVAFDVAQAEFAASLEMIARSVGLSLGDRACLALARALGAVALTADRVWASIDIGVTVELIR